MSLFALLKKGAVFVVGGLIFIVGIVLIPLPGPGLLICAAGLFVLSTEFKWAARGLVKLRKFIKSTLNRTTSKPTSVNPIVISRRLLWITIFAVAVAGSVGALHFQHQQTKNPVGGSLALQRLDLLYLNEPAPDLEQLRAQNQRTVVVFCKACALPEVPSAHVIRSSDAAIAAHYSLVKQDGTIGPGYVLISSTGTLRYRTFDLTPSLHSGEIDRLVRHIP